MNIDSYKTIEIKDGHIKSALILSSEDLPLIIKYGGKRYVLILTKNDKLILQKTID
ncbi:MAG: hemin uptake protein HemP [Nitrospirae bacterium]|nr:hemin uptake protein HemP [Nitrospirota bacterium]MCL5977229.1 hemin uptake protein HemP [Nitrospirota bacterium]